MRTSRKRKCPLPKRSLVDNGNLIAQALGVPESVIALTFVALGTSLPELVTAITSLAKGHGSLSLGNVIGANVFNLVLVSGMSITVSPFSIPQNSTIMGINSSLVMDLPVMFAVMLLLTVPALLKGRLSRWQGVLLLCIYAVCNVSLCAGDPARLHARAGALGQKTVLRKASSFAGMPFFCPCSRV